MPRLTSCLQLASSLGSGRLPHSVPLPGWNWNSGTQQLQPWAPPTLPAVDLVQSLQIVRHDDADPARGQGGGAHAVSQSRRARGRRGVRARREVTRGRHAAPGPCRGVPLPIPRREPASASHGQSCVLLGWFAGFPSSMLLAMPLAGMVEAVQSSRQQLLLPRTTTLEGERN